MENLNETISKNLIKLRKSQKLTQLELAEKLNYSDKSISKWEKGEAVPSLEVLVSIAEMFSLPLDYFISTPEKKVVIPKPKRKNKVILTLISISLVWLVAISTYIVLNAGFGINFWMVYLWAVPACFVVTTVFACIWSHKKRLIYISVSLLIWTLITAIFLQVIHLNLWMLYLTGIPLQCGVILWAFLKR